MSAREKWTDARLASRFPRHARADGKARARGLLAFEEVDRFPRVVLGYHGCLASRATALLSGKLPIEEWPPSDDQFEWLGRGVYFWEHGPRRALEWAREKAKRGGGREKPAVVGAVIGLARCLDLMDTADTEVIGRSHERLRKIFERGGQTLPENEKAGREDVGERKRRYLDCLVINYSLERIRARGRPVEAVRAAFWEGEPVYRGAAFRRASHIQIAVIDPRCILGVFRPNLA